MAVPPEDPLHWKHSLTPPPAPESRAETPNRAPEDSSRIGFWDMQTSRMPTPVQWLDERARSATPSACLQGVAAPLARSAALDYYARSSSACSDRCGSRAATTPTTARPSRLSWREKSPFELEDEELLRRVQSPEQDDFLSADPRTIEADLLHKILFRRRPPPEAEADNACPNRALAAPPGLMKAKTQPESELLFSISKNFRMASAQGVAQRFPYGAPPVQPHPTTSPPAQLAAPVVKPHNAWCTFITWVPPASGSDDDDFSYEMNVRMADSENCMLVSEIGQEPKVKLNGLEAGKIYFFQVRACNALGNSDWSFWSEGYLVPNPLQTVVRNEEGEEIEPLSSSDSPTSIKLEWDEPCSQGAPIIGYRVQYSLDPAEGVDETITSLHRRTWLVVNDLKPSHLYFFRVQALNEVGASEWTNWSDAVATKAVGPETPEPPTLCHAESRALSIAWTEPFSFGFRLDSYDVKVSCEDSSMKHAILIRGDKALAEKCSMELQDLEPMHEYYFQVRAVASTGTSEFSKVAGPFKTTMAVAAKCTDLQVTKNETRKVGLQFCTPETFRLPILKFIVRWSEDYLMREEIGRMEVPLERPICGKGSNIDCTVPGLQPGLVLHFEVAAVTEAGVGHFSAGTGEVVCHCDKPGLPKPPTCKETTKSTFVLEVEDTAEENGSPIFRYELRYDLSPMMLRAVMMTGGMKCIREAGASGPRVFQHILAGLEKRGPYYFQTRCWNAAGISPWSECSAPLLLKVSEPARLAAVTLVEADSKTSLIVKYIQAGDLGAKYGGNIIDYELRYARKEKYLEDPDAGVLNLEESGGSPDQVGLLRWPAPKHGDSPPVRVGGLITGRSYFFQVRAISAYGPGQWSFASAPFKTLSSRPERPQAIQVAKGVLNPYSAKLKMVLPEGNGSPVTGCRLHFLGPNWKTRPEVTEWKELKIVEAEDCEVDKIPLQENIDHATDAFIHLWDFTVLHLEPGASYRFKFSCINDVGESDTSDVSNLVTTMPTSPDKCTAPFLTSEEDAKPYSITFHWHTPHDGGAEIQFYTLIWATNMRFQGFKVIENIKETSYTLDSMQPNMKFYLRVAATNEVGQGKFSDCIPHMGQGVVATIPRVPSVTRELEGEPHPKVVGAVVLKWLKPFEDGGCMISRYRICYSLHEDFKEAKEKNHKAGREARINDLKPETEYYFKVAALNAVGQGPYGEVVMVKTLPVPPEKFIPPRQPAAPTVQLLSVDGVERLKVKWTIPESWDNRVGFIYDADKQTHMITHYSVYLQGGYPSADVNEHEELRENVPQVRDFRTRPKNNSNVVTFEGLVPGRYYHCIVKAFSQAGESPWSLPSEVVRASPGRPNDIAEVHVVGTTSTSITVNWPSPSGNGESVQHFYVRCREVRVLRGWEGGSPNHPEHSDPTAGQYEDVNRWWTNVKIPFRRKIVGDGDDSAIAEKRSSVLGGDVQIYVLEGLQPASYYQLEAVAENIIGLSDPTVSGEVRTRSTEPGPPGRCQGKPGDATIYSVKFHWKAPTYHGGEDILGYEVRWISNEVGKAAPTDLDLFLNSSNRFIVGPDCFELVAEGLHPGDAAVPIVRAWTEVGHGDWSLLPSDAEIEDLSSRPDFPAEITTAPVIERTAAEDHKLYSLKTTWACPDMMGRPILYFKVKLVRADTEEDRQAMIKAGKVPAPAASEEEPHEFTVECVPQRPWVMGETIEIARLHKALTPGTPYVAYVRATTMVGDAKGWGVASAPQTAPPDYPSKPEKPSCPWQWPTALEVHWKEPWLRGSDLERCEFQYSLDPDLANIVEVPYDVAHKSFGEKQIHVENLEYATVYYFRVRIKNAVGWSEWSDISEGFMTGACRPAPPKRPILEHIDMEQLVFRWPLPDSHGCPIDKYEVFLADQGQVAKVPQLVEDLNKCETEEEQKALLEALPVKELHDIKVEELTNRKEPDHIFEGLLGGLPYAVSVRAHNLEGWSDWSEALDDIVSPSAAPEEAPAPWMLEATKDSLHVGFSLPYDNGDRITKAEVCWFRISGPMERHIALGGKVTVPGYGQNKEEEEGGTMVDVPATVERALPEQYGGSHEAWLTGLQPGTEYEVQVSCINSHGNGSYSIGMIMVCAAGIPDMPGRIRHADAEAEAEDHFAPSTFNRMTSDMSQGNLSDIETPPTPRSTDDEDEDEDEEEGEAEEAEADEALELPPAPPVQSGALFFKRTQQLTAPDEVVNMGNKTARQRWWRFRGSGFARVQPAEASDPP